MKQKHFPFTKFFTVSCILLVHCYPDLQKEYAQKSGRCAKEQRERSLCTLSRFAACTEDMKSKGLGPPPDAVCAEMIFLIDAICDNRHDECRP